MIKKNKLIVLFLVLFGLLFSSCSSLTGDDTQTSGISIGKGSSSSSGNGVSLTFGDSNVDPQKGFEFPLQLIINNYQRHAIDDLKIKPTGFDWGYVSGLDREYNVRMGAATESGPNQYSQLIQSIKLDGFTGSYPFDPTFKYCYSAKTVFRETVCVPDKFGACDISGGDNFENGPLNINIDRIYPRGEQDILVEFSVKDSAGGNIVNECFQDERKMDFGNVYALQDIKLGSSSGNCKPLSSDTYVVNSGTSKFLCEFTRSSEDQYSAQLSAGLDYKYQQQAQKKITIRDLQIG